MSEPRVCICCQHFVFNAGDAGYSGYTPGTEWSIYCLKNKFVSLDGYDVTQDQYRRTLLTAEKCTEWTPRAALGAPEEQKK